jgi:hypothetical protein
MKRFENRVLTFDLDAKKSYAAMEAQLAEWGEAGFEVVSAVPADMHGRQVHVFLKRELDGAEGTS